MAIVSRNPATGQELKRFEPYTPDQVEQRLRRAEEAFAAWRNVSFAERGAIMTRAAEILEAEADQLGKLMTTEMGKPIEQAVAEAQKCAWVCRYYAEHAEEYLADQTIETDARRSYVRHEPLGPILAIMPWNFPFWQVFRFAAPALMAGNVALLKHASNVPQCALAIEDLLLRAGLPEGVFQTLLIGAKEAQALISRPQIKAVTLTGSTGAGQQVASAAGASIKKTVLELGGSDPFIVLPTADLDQVVETAVKARMVNNGQSCIAAKRFIVHEQVADEFQRRFAARLQAMTVGDPSDPQTELGPLATPDLVDLLDDQVRRSVEAGAKVVVGGKRLEREGAYYAPTLLTDVPEDSPANQEELFGPVASMYRARDLDEVIRVANDTVFGLGASVWSHDEAEIERLVREIEAGMVFVNEQVKSDPRVPFGGVKLSGYGRELNAHGIHEFVNIKTVWIS